VHERIRGSEFGVWAWPEELVWCAPHSRSETPACEGRWYIAGGALMDLRVIGCHGGETPKHRTSAFVLDDRLAIDAGSLTSGMDLPAQWRLEACLVSHAHLDHVRDLATIADNRVQKGCKPLIVAGTKATLAILRKHFFNGLLWPDFAVIPTPEKPTIRYLPLKPEVPTKVAGFLVRAILVSHTIECCAFIVDGPDGSVAYSGDTGPTDRLWECLNDVPKLRALLMEVSFPNAQARLAKVSGHHTPKTLAADLTKYKNASDLPVLLYHIKPSFQATVERECARLRGLNLTVLALGDQFLL
jgi:ribonuclease BN (tRNA processing enzyme)